MLKIGSQVRERLADTEYKLVSRPYPKKVILQDENGKQELWAANNNYAGYVIQIGRWSYEFVSSLKS